MVKALITLLIIIGFQSVSFSQSGWFWQNPLPQGSTLNSVKFVNAQTGIAAGNLGAILRTTDAGENWILYNSDFTNDIYSVAYSDVNKIFAVGSDGLIIRTTNSGITWQRFSIGTNDTLNSIYFFDSNTGYITGSNGKIFKTTDAGDNWLEQISGTLNKLNCSYFINSDKGFIGGNNKLLKTTNGGNNWSVSDFSTIINSYSFINENTGYLVGGNVNGVKEFRRTTNGGTSWLSINTPGTRTLNEIVFINSTTGFVAGIENTFLKTTDGGTNWVLDNTISSEFFALNSVNFTNSGEGYLVGTYGTIFKSTDFGNFWTAKAPSGTFETMTQALFTSMNTGYVVGSSIFKTTNGGNNWTDLNTPFSWLLKGLQFFNETGYIQSFPDFYKTQNGGLNWTKINSSQDTIVGPEFLNSNTGFCTKTPYFYDHILYKTTNGGLSWNQNSFYPDYVGSYNFPLSNIGYLIVTDLNEFELYKSTNTGENWIYMNDLEYDTILPFHKLQFINEYVGFNISFSNAGNHIILYRTTNGGASWDQVYEVFGGYLNPRLDFIDSNTGFLEGLQNKFVKTTDQGENWFDYNVGNPNIIDLEFIDEDTVYAAGLGGLIMKTTNGGTVSIENISSIIPTGFMLKQNYPNPFNPNTIISYDLPFNDFVSLKVFDILGKEVMTLVNEMQSAGSYKVDFRGDNLSSSVYFYKFKAGDFTETKKMVLIR